MTPARQGWTLLGRLRRLLASDDAQEQLLVGALCGVAFGLLVGMTLFSGCATVPTAPSDAGDLPYCSQARTPWRSPMSLEDRQLLCEPRRIQEVAPPELWPDGGWPGYPGWPGCVPFPGGGLACNVTGNTPEAQP